MINKKLIIASTLCNCSVFLPDFIKNIKFISKLFVETKIIFVESDSQDETLGVLKKHKDDLNLEVFSFGNLKNTIPLRTGRISKARNFYLDYVEKNYKDYDLLLVMDCNETNIEPITEEAILSNFKFDDWDMICANQKHIYYDLWALRHPIWMPFDCWEMIYSNYCNFLSHKDKLNMFLKSRFINIDENLPPILVDSAFGGSGFIKINSINGARHSFLNKNGYETCEWPSFCEKLNNGNAKIYINPKFINQSLPNKHVNL